MPSRIEDIPNDSKKIYEHKQCKHPEHEPPMHIVIPSGKQLVHTCPACGKTTTIKSNQPMF